MIVKYGVVEQEQLEVIKDGNVPSWVRQSTGQPDAQPAQADSGEEDDTDSDKEVETQ